MAFPARDRVGELGGGHDERVALAGIGGYEAARIDLRSLRATRAYPPMAVAVVLDFDGATLDQYDQVIQKMGFTPRGAGGPGGIFHWVTKTDNGIRVTDVWETREHFPEIRGGADRALHAGSRHQRPSQTTFYEVHNYLIAG